METVLSGEKTASLSLQDAMTSAGKGLNVASATCSTGCVGTSGNGASKLIK